ncbi:MAG: IPT/TIG domain-containing protein, partial [Candidatus Thermoplasmatota archaeon]
GRTIDGLSDKVVVYLANDNSTIVLPERLPEPIAAGAAARVGDRVFVLGGQNAAGPTSRIVSIDPATGSIEVLPQLLPYAVSNASAVWTGTEILVIGGIGATGDVDTIVAFDPASGISRVTSMRLPSVRSDTTAVWLDGRAIVLGGRHLDCSDPSGVCYLGWRSEILSIDPSTGTVTILPPRINGDQGLEGVAAVVRGAYVYFFGGYGLGSGTDIVRLDVASGTLMQMLPWLPRQLDHAAALLTPNAILIVGGSADGGPTSDVVRFTLEPGDIQYVEVRPTDRLGEADVWWVAPFPNTYEGQVSFNVYRSLVPGKEVPIASGIPDAHFVDSGLDNGTLYHYRVSASTADGEGPLFPEVRFRTPNVPRVLSFTPSRAPAEAFNDVTVHGENFTYHPEGNRGPDISYVSHLQFAGRIYYPQNLDNATDGVFRAVLSPDAGNFSVVIANAWAESSLCCLQITTGSKIESVSPTTARAGDLVTARGYGLGLAPVWIGGQHASRTNISYEEVRFIVPNVTDGHYDVNVGLFSFEPPRDTYCCLDVASPDLAVRITSVTAIDPVGLVRNVTVELSNVGTGQLDDARLDLTAHAQLAGVIDTEQRIGSASLGHPIAPGEATSLTFTWIGAWGSTTLVAHGTAANPDVHPENNEDARITDNLDDRMPGGFVLPTALLP